MQQHFMLDVYLLDLSLLFVGFLARSYWRLWKRIGPKALWTLTPGTMPWYLFRLVVTSVVAGLISAELLCGDSAVLVWLVLWPGLYWLWKYWDPQRRKGAMISNGAQIAAQGPPPFAATVVKPRRTWRRNLRNTALVVVAFLVSCMVGLIYSLDYYEKQAEAERSKVHIGMTAEEVLPAVRGWGGLRAHAVLPADINNADINNDDGSHYVSLILGSDSRYHYSEPPAWEPRNLAIPKPPP